MPSPFPRPPYRLADLLKALDRQRRREQRRFQRHAIDVPEDFDNHARPWDAILDVLARQTGVALDAVRAVGECLVHDRVVPVDLVSPAGTIESWADQPGVVQRLLATMWDHYPREAADVGLPLCWGSPRLRELLRRAVHALARFSDQAGRLADGLPEIGISLHELQALAGYLEDEHFRPDGEQLRADAEELFRISFRLKAAQEVATRSPGEQSRNLGFMGLDKPDGRGTQCQMGRVIAASMLGKLISVVRALAHEAVERMGDPGPDDGEGHGPTDPNGATLKPSGANRDHAEALSLEAKALAALTDHPDWSMGKIAKAVGCSRGHLYRMERLMTARELIRKGRADLPGGQKDAETGDIEAWDRD